MGWFAHNPASMRRQTGVFRNASQNSPQVVFVSHLSVKCPKAKFQCSDGWISKLTGVGTIHAENDWKWNLFSWFGDWFLVCFRVRWACVDISDAHNVIWGWSKWIIIKKWPIVINDSWSVSKEIIMSWARLHVILTFVPLWGRTKKVVLRQPFFGALCLSRSRLCTFLRLRWLVDGLTVLPLFLKTICLKCHFIRASWSFKEPLCARNVHDSSTKVASWLGILFGSFSLLRQWCVNVSLIWTLIVGVLWMIAKSVLSWPQPKDTSMGSLQSSSVLLQFIVWLNLRKIFELADDVFFRQNCTRLFLPCWCWLHCGQWESPFWQQEKGSEMVTANSGQEEQWEPALDRWQVRKHNDATHRLNQVQGASATVTAGMDPLTPQGGPTSTVQLGSGTPTAGQPGAHQSSWTREHPIPSLHSRKISLIS